MHKVKTQHAYFLIIAMVIIKNYNFKNYLTNFRKFLERLE